MVSTDRPPAALALRFLSCEILVRADSALQREIVRLLGEYVPDTEGAPRAGTAVTEVVVLRSPAELALLRKRFAGAARQTVLRPFKEHTGTEFVRAAQVGGDQVLVAEHWRDLAIVQSGRTIRIVVSDDRPCPSDVLLYVIREIVLRAGYRRRDLLLHGASLWAPATGGVLLLGDKGAGKTTSLISMLATEPGVQLISNDRSYVTNGPRPQVLGYPQSIRIGAGTAYAFPQLHRALRRSYRSRNAEKLALLARSAPTHRKFSLTPAALAKVFGRGHISAAPLGAIIALVAAPTEQWRRLEQAEKAAAIAAAQFLEPDELYPDQWLGSNAIGSNRQERPCWEDVPAFSLALPIDTPAQRRRQLIGLITSAALDAS